MHVLASDLAKAFDLINTEAMINALRRLGLPSYVLEVVQAICADRVFCVSDLGALSERKRQGLVMC